MKSRHSGFAVARGPCRTVPYDGIVAFRLDFAEFLFGKATPELEILWIFGLGCDAVF